jgi:2-phospho-L-lactate guanylyltransferase
VAQALVPLKDLVQAKTRLAGILRPSERRALAQAMAEDVLLVLSTHPAIARVTLVSDDPGAALLAASYGVDYCSEQSLGCQGLNAVVQCVSERLLAQAEEPLLVLHGDLPLLSCADIDAVLEAQQALAGLVIGSDLQGSGTNLLAFNARSIPRFRFGHDSCAAHLAWAHSADVPVAVLQRSGIAFDVDEAHDLKVILAAASRDTTGKTFTLLRDTELGARLAPALESLILDNGMSATKESDSGMDREIAS